MKGLEIEAVYENGTLKLPRLLPLTEGQKVTITVHQAAGVVHEPAHQAASPSPLGEALLRHAGKAVGLPEDMAAQHDHYLHGTPKR
jgi:predicted DNA-binding antitoxin AbrB/MazE fold protein